jgi:hypothetical protein
MFSDLILNFTPILGIIGSLGTAGSILAYASVAAGLAGTALSYVSSQNQAKQAEMNADAQNQALKQEQDRQALEQAENQRRALTVQKRERARAAAALASTGAMTTSGTPLALLADTWETQQTQLADQSYLADMAQRELAYRRTSALAMGKNEAGNIRAAGIGTALGQLGQLGSQGYSMFRTTKKTA